MTKHVALQRPARGPGFAEFVVLMAALQALGALGIDAMLPNLPAIGQTLGVVDENRRMIGLITVDDVLEVTLPGDWRRREAAEPPDGLH